MEGIHISLKAEKIFDFFGFPITNTLLMSWIVMIVLIVLGILVGKNLKTIPGKLQTLFEAVFGFLLGYIEEVLESRKLAMRFFPLIATLFMFILLGNWFGLLPGIGSITVKGPAEGTVQTEHATAPAEHSTDIGEQSTGGNPTPNIEHTTDVPLFHPISTDLNITLALAIIAFVSIEVSGVIMIGALKYGSKFVNFKSLIGFFVGIIELISELARLVSFSFRLFGNMFAGKVLILVITFFIPFVVPVPLMLYEFFVGFVQAAIFSLLTLFFLKIAISEAH